MPSSKKRKERPNVSIEEYLQLFVDNISTDEYLKYEIQRAKKSLTILPSTWFDILKRQSLKCYYCGIELEVIQKLILNRIIAPRKRGPDSYSGFHFEVDHKNAHNEDNRIENIVAACYYCNNDKSNTLTSDIFKKYFGPYKNQAFNQLFFDSNLEKNGYLRHNLKEKNNS